MVVHFHTVEAKYAHCPDVEIRLEIPFNLRAAMRALQSISNEIKTKHQSWRHNVLFDDDDMDLVFDFSLGEGQPWKKITSAQAMAKKKKKNASSNARSKVQYFKP